LSHVYLLVDCVMDHNQNTFITLPHIIYLRVASGRQPDVFGLADSSTLVHEFQLLISLTSTGVPAVNLNSDFYNGLIKNLS